MAESSYDKIAEIADYLKLSISAEEIAGCFTKLNMNQEEIDKTVEFFEILEERKKEAVVNTCLWHLEERAANWGIRSIS